MKSTLFVFFVKYVVEAPVGTSSLLIFSFAAQMASIPIWMRISRRLGKHKTVGIGTTCAGIGFGSYALVGPGDIVLFTFCVMLSGFGAGAAAFLLRSMTADIIDYDNSKSGADRSGLLFSVLSMTTKIGPAIAVGTTFPALSFLGFNPGAAAPSPSWIAALRFFYIGMPLALMLGAAYLIYRFQLDEEVQKTLRRQIDARDDSALGAEHASAGVDR